MADLITFFNETTENNEFKFLFRNNLVLNGFNFNPVDYKKREEKFMMYLFNSLLELKVIVSDCQKDERYFVETFCFINEQLLELKANYLNLLHESEKQIKNFNEHTSIIGGQISLIKHQGKIIKEQGETIKELQKSFKDLTLSKSTVSSLNYHRYSKLSDQLNSLTEFMELLKIVFFIVLVASFFF